MVLDICYIQISVFFQEDPRKEDFVRIYTYYGIHLLLLDGMLRLGDMKTVCHWGCFKKRMPPCIL